MNHFESTCWTMIQAAAAGHSAVREDFARRYEPIIRAYLRARWKGSGYLADLEDAIQEVFIECFKSQGLLDKADREMGGFRSFLFGAVRNVALRLESRRGRQREQQAAADEDLADVEGREASLSAVFDQAWLKALLQQAVQRHRSQAKEKGARAWQRAELLRLRFDEGLPIREIAKRWDCDAAVLHHEYARARQEFKQALLDVVSFHRPGPPEEIEKECVRLLTLLR